jgi:hypothetical protein
VRTSSRQARQACHTASGPERIGVRALNLLDRFEPQDVQNILPSPRFGQFFNSDPISPRLTLRLQL